MPGDLTDWLTRAALGSLSIVRDSERIGPVMLSIQASSAHYCRPRVDGLPLEQYEAVEVALWQAEYEGSSLLGRPWITKPSDLMETEEFDSLWTGDDVAGWVPLATALELRDALRYRYSE